MVDTQKADSNSLSRMFFMSVGVIALGLVVLLFTLPTTTSARSDTSDAAQASALAVVAANVFDGKTWQANTTIVIEDGRIAAMGENIALPDGARRIDGQGHSVLPGLIDAHVHSFGSALSDSLRFGVTTNLDMFTSPAGLPRTRAAREDTGNIEEADLFSAGMLATVEGGHGTQYGVPMETLTADTDIDAWVARRVDEGSDYIKLVYMPYQTRLPSLDLTLAKAIIKAAHDAGLMAVAHISSARAALDLIVADVDGLVHIFADEPASDELVREAKARGVFVIPTLTVLATADQQGEGAALARDANFKTELTAEQISSLKSDFGFKVPTMTLAGALENVRRLHAAGVPILAGSDAPNPGTTYGASVHLEMELLVRAGLSPTEALQTATSVPASAFGLDQRGTLAVGQRADLMVVAGDPASDILATRAIRHVLRNGANVARDLEATVTAAMPRGTLSDFAQGIGAPQGFSWSATDDGEMRGQSEASISHLAPTDAIPTGAVRVQTNVRRGFAWPWAGLYFVAEDGKPRSFRGTQTLSMRLRGTPGTYRVMLFNAGSTGAPPTHELTVTDAWQTFDVQLSEVNGLDPGNVAGFTIVAGPAPGEFRFDVADVSLK